MISRDANQQRAQIERTDFPAVDLPLRLLSSNRLPTGEIFRRCCALTCLLTYVLAVTPFLVWATADLAELDDSRSFCVTTGSGKITSAMTREPASPAKSPQRHHGLAASELALLAATPIGESDHLAGMQSCPDSMVPEEKICLKFGGRGATFGEAAFAFRVPARAQGGPAIGEPSRSAALFPAWIVRTIVLLI